MIIRALALAAATLSLSACVVEVEDTGTSDAPAVGSSTDLSSFEGARAGQAELGITNLGYELVRSAGLTSYWFNSETGACAEITTSDGRYSSINMLPAGDC